MNTEKRKTRNQKIFALYNEAAEGKKTETVEELAKRNKLTVQAVYKIIAKMKGGSK